MGSDFPFQRTILDFTMQDMLTPGFLRKAKDILEFWFGYEIENIQRVKLGIQQFHMPVAYTTNTTRKTSLVIQGLGKGNNDLFIKSLPFFTEIISWYANQFHLREYRKEAVRCAILRRLVTQTFASSIPESHLDTIRLFDDINQRLAKSRYAYEGADFVNAAIDQLFENAGEQ